MREAGLEPGPQRGEKTWVEFVKMQSATQWITERASEFIRHARDNKIAVDLVFHDADRKVSKAFRESLRIRGARPRKLHPRSPNLNAYVERWIQSIQVECLDHVMVLGAAQLDHLVQEFVAHYHEERPHQGLDNKLVVPGKPPPDDEVPRLPAVVRRERLGRLLEHYERRAA